MDIRAQTYGYELETDGETVSFCSNAPASPTHQSGHLGAVYPMDDNLYNLNLDYLLVAKEMIAAGNAYKAQFYLGLPSEAIAILRNMTTKQMKALARSDYLKFSPRFNPSHWQEFMQAQALGVDSHEQQAKELLMLLSNENPS